MNKKTLLIGGGAVAILLVFLYMRSRSSAGSAPVDTTGTAQDQAANDYATLAGMLQQQQGQEASDVAALGGQIATDTGNWQGSLALAQGQEQADVAGLNAAETAWPQSVVSAIGSQSGMIAQLHQDLVGVQAGQKSLRTDVNKLQHPPKKPSPKRKPPKPNPHVNNHHPAGTAGHAVGQRSHQPKPATIHRPAPGAGHAPHPTPKPRYVAPKRKR